MSNVCAKFYSFTPLLFTTTGSMADAADHVYRRLANLLSEKLDLSYGEVMGWIRCKLSFALVRSAVMCIHGARSQLYTHLFLNFLYECPDACF